MTDRFRQFFDIPENNIDIEKQKFTDNMNMLKTMSVQEFTLYKKYKEVNGSFRHQHDSARVVKAKIWTPTDLNDKDRTIQEIESIRPVIKFVPFNSLEEEDWNILRIFAHTMQFDQNPGRFLRFSVLDEVTGKYLGIASLGSDVITITCRDKWIGWTKENRLEHGKLNNSAIGTCIMATQPFGFNFLGGKLVASLLTTQSVADTWDEIYGNILVGLTTTSLYGADSMYNSIPFWKGIGISKGLVTIKPDDDIYEFWHHWVKDNMPDEYEDKTTKKKDISGPPTNVKQKILSIIFKQVGLKMSDYNHGFERGVYYALRFENTREFLRGEITKEYLIPSPKLKNDVDSVLNWWRPKAINRYTKLFDENRLKPEILFYDKMINERWEDSKQAYLAEVGR